jgi:hypothetical protein
MKTKFWNFLHLWFLYVVFGCLIVTNSGCNQTINTSSTVIKSTTINVEEPIVTPNYKYFELKSDDIRFSVPVEFIKPQQFSLEYPAQFDYSDLAESDNRHFDKNISYFDFINHQSNGLDEVALMIIIQKPGYQNEFNPHDIISHLRNTTNLQYVNEKNITVAGCQADYLEYSKYVDANDVYPAHNMIFKSAVFDYQNNIWSIRLFWPYSSRASEPPEAATYFNHIIVTFKIID